MSSKSIGHCLCCDQDFCMECTDAKDPETYCSKACERDAKEDGEHND